MSSRLPDLPKQGTRLTDLHLQFAGESVSACGQTLTVREVGSDRQVVCGCGWVGIPVIARPSVLRCEACDTLAEGRRRAADFADSIVACLRLQNSMWLAVNSTLEGNR